MTGLSDYIAAEGIRATVRDADSNPNMRDQDWPANHYRVTIRARGGRMVVPFSQGLGITREPDAAAVLDCLASDAAGYENARGDFEEWAAEYGYDLDSRRAFRTFRAVERQSTRLRAVLGEDAYASLLWDTDR